MNRTDAPAAAHQYRGQTIERDDTVPVGRRGRYTWGGRHFAQLNHAKTAINDHYHQQHQELNPCTPS